MPKKRKNVWPRNRKEKQLITARLIEMSLKVEGYIYNHQPITDTEAKSYIQEVTSYKTLCSGDERSLQVIEKLTRCMNAIIVEHKELRDDICTFKDGRSVADDDVCARCLSPVYSISDEDRTQLTQIVDESTRSNTEANKDVEIIDLCNIDDDEVVDNDITNTGTVCSIHSRIHVEVDIHRAISNLSLKEVEAIPKTVFSDVEQSQSILNNFEIIENMGQNNINVTCKGAITKGLRENIADTVIKRQLNDYKNIVKTTNTNKGLSRIQNNGTTLGNQSNESLKLKSTNRKEQLNTPKITDTFEDETVLHDTDAMKAFITTNSVTKMCCQNNDQITTEVFYSCKETTDSQRKTWYDSDRTCTVHHSDVQDIAHKLKLAQLNKTVDMQDAKAVDAARTKSKIDKTLNTNVNGNSGTIKKKRGPRKKKVLTEDTKPKNKISRNPKRTKKKATNLNEKDQSIPIYNRNIENDLSWIENIRYVREMKEDEHDSNLIIEESFWDNYDLPGNWNDNDFL